MEEIIQYIRLLEKLNNEYLKLLNLLQNELDFQLFICSVYEISFVILGFFILLIIFFDNIFSFFHDFKTLKIWGQKP